MYELVQLTEQSYYIDCPAKIGVYRTAEKEVYLIDSGSDKDAGRRCRKILDEQGWTCRGILLTHSHADHMGGCAYLQKQYGCKVFAGGIEGAIARYPLLEPSLLYGGAPYKELRNKFLMAQPCEAVGFDDADFPAGVKVLPLPGHYFDMVGFRLPDGVVFLADCVSSVDTLLKYRIGYLYNVPQYLDTLMQVSQMEATYFVPAHAGVTNNIAPLCQVNADAVGSAMELIENLCTGINFEEILRQVFEAYELTMTHEQYVLIGSTVRSYLSYLKDEGIITATIDDNRVIWSKTDDEE